MTNERMTNEEAANILSRFAVNDNGTITQHSWYDKIQQDTKEAINLAIESLKQEGKSDTIDKIRAEINGMYRVVLKGTPEDDWAVRWNQCLDEVLQTIDKYKVESEGWGMKRLCLCSLIVGLLLTGCGERSSEIITLYGHNKWDYDNSTLVLKDGYFVRDYSIDYENKTIVMNLERDEE